VFWGEGKHAPKLAVFGVHGSSAIYVQWSLLTRRPSNRKLPVTTRQQALTVLKQPEWHGMILGRHSPLTNWPNIIRFRWCRAVVKHEIFASLFSVTYHV
jgi:hypothetical protein